MEGVKVVADMEAAKVAGSPSKAGEGLPGAGLDQRQHPEGAPTEGLMGAVKQDTGLSKTSLMASKQVGCAQPGSGEGHTCSCCCCRAR